MSKQKEQSVSNAWRLIAIVAGAGALAAIGGIVHSGAASAHDTSETPRGATGSGQSMVHCRRVSMPATMALTSPSG